MANSCVAWLSISPTVAADQRRRSDPRPAPEASAADRHAGIHERPIPGAERSAPTNWRLFASH